MTESDVQEILAKVRAYGNRCAWAAHDRSRGSAESAQRIDAEADAIHDEIEAMLRRLGGTR